MALTSASRHHSIRCGPEYNQKAEEGKFALLVELGHLSSALRHWCSSFLGLWF